MPEKRLALTSRVREYRKRKGLTLQQVAASMGTSAQTVQRLETGKMRMSLEWLEKFARALDVDTGELIANRPGRAIEDLGELTAAGLVVAAPIAGLAEGRPPLVLEIPAREPVSVKLASRIGPYEEGTILVGDRLPAASHERANGRYCLANISGGRLLLRRVVVDPRSRVALIGYDDADPVLFDVELVWLAPIVLTLRYL
jgi:transcriptional regulator with XRE-family HTH domain